MKSSGVRIDSPRNGVATITLDVPETRNALSIAVRDDVTEGLERLAENEHVKVVVVTGAGATFCSGFDLREFRHVDDDPDLAERVWTSGDRFHRACLSFPLPMVAAVNGPAIAGGFDLAVMCDLRVAVRSAHFEHPEREFSEVVYGPLQDLVGASVARDLALTGRSVSGEDAFDLHLVNRLVDDPVALDAAVREITSQITHAPREILMRMKKKIIARADVVRDRTLDL